MSSPVFGNVTELDFPYLSKSISFCVILDFIKEQKIGLKPILVALKVKFSNYGEG